MHSTLASIRRKLTAVRTAVRCLYVVDGSLRLVLVATLLIVSGYTLDRLIEFPWLMRMCLLLIQLAVLAAAVFRFVVFPCRVSITVEDIAGQVELRNPFLKDRLISALQLERLVTDPEYADSVALTHAVIREAEELAGGIRFYRILHPRPVIWLALLTLLVLGGLGTAAVTWPREAKIWALRNVYLVDRTWPRDNSIYLVRRTFKVTEGNALQVQFLLDGRLENADDVELRVLQPIRASSATDALLEPTRALRVGGDVAKLQEQVDGNPKTLLFRESSLPLTQGETDDGHVLTATLPPQSGPVLLFLRTEDRYSRPFLSIRFEKVLSPFYEVVPTRAVIKETLVKVPHPDYQIYVPRGHNLKLGAVVFGPIPRERTSIHYTLGKEDPQADPMTPSDSDNRFSHEDFSEVRAAMSFRLASGDQEPTGPEYRVHVRVPPKVSEHDFDFAFPSYLGRRADPELAKKRDFLNLPLGTRFGLTIHGDFTKAVKEKGSKLPAVPYLARLRFTSERMGEILLKQVGDPQPIKGDRVRVTFTGDFLATRDTSFFFQLRGPNRLTNESPTHYQVSVVPDRPPVIEPVRPPGSEAYKASRNASLRMVVNSSDDHGLGQIVLRYRLDNETAYKERVLKPAAHPFKIQYPAGKAPTDEPPKKTITYQWELEKIDGVKPGRTIHYYYMAEDYSPFELSDKGELVRRKHGNRTHLRNGYSEQTFNADRPDFKIRVVTKLEIEQHINEQLLLLRKEMIELRKAQRNIHSTTLSYTKNESFTATHLDGLFQLELRQNDLTRGTGDRVRSPLIAIQEMYQENNLSPGVGVGEMVRLSSLIFQTLSPSVSDRLKQAQSIRDEAAVARRLLTEATKIQAEISKHFETMIEEMQKWEDLSEVIQNAQNLLKQQRDIHEETKRLRKKR